MNDPSMTGNCAYGDEPDTTNCRLFVGEKEQANTADSKGSASDLWKCGDCYSEHKTEIEAACCCH